MSRPPTGSVRPTFELHVQGMGTRGSFDSSVAFWPDQKRGCDDEPAGTRQCICEGVLDPHVTDVASAKNRLERQPVRACLRRVVSVCGWLLDLRSA